MVQVSSNKSLKMPLQCFVIVLLGETPKKVIIEALRI